MIPRNIVDVSRDTAAAKVELTMLNTDGSTYKSTVYANEEVTLGLTLEQLKSKMSNEDFVFLVEAIEAYGELQYNRGFDAGYSSGSDNFCI